MEEFTADDGRLHAQFHFNLQKRPAFNAMYQMLKKCQWITHLPVLHILGGRSWTCASQGSLFHICRLEPEQDSRSFPYNSLF